MPEYNINNLPRAITFLNVETIRVVCHTTGARSEVSSNNHWTIYLVYPEGSLRLNMRETSYSNKRGKLEITNYGYQTPSNSAVEYWDFPVITKPLAVHYIMELIRDYKRDLYEYRPSGMGCQF
jgi:hypothetical protein